MRKKFGLESNVRDHLGIGYKFDINILKVLLPLPNCKDGIKFRSWTNFSTSFFFMFGFYKGLT